MWETLCESIDNEEVIDPAQVLFYPNEHRASSWKMFHEGDKTETSHFFPPFLYLKSVQLQMQLV